MKTYILTCCSCYGQTLYTKEDIYHDYGYGGIVAFVECSKCKKANDVSDRDYNYDSVKPKDAIMTCSSCGNKTYYGIENIEEGDKVKCPNCGSFNQIDL
jgi:DNA-directed RNA polymerase subunit RPC12/RpoP